MTTADRRIYPTYKIWVDAQTITSGRSTPSVATEISADLVSIQTDRAILPTTPVKVAIVLDDEILLQGSVVWVLDRVTDEGRHYYLTGIRTDAIIHPKIKAVGLAEKSRLLQEILFGIMGKNNN